MDPPQCVQNAMMTKDKKPFTYTPGGIDLSEVRSPRMARRIERNAHLPGSGECARPTPHPHQNLDHLPASTLAAMRPQPQVQVFPSPPPAVPFKTAVPPPPPPPSSQGIPPPPPPPTAPLPTQKVKTGDNQVLERPDMTKIIPDNPMTLLRKTGGPQTRKSLVDEMFAQAGKPAPQMTPSMQPQNRYQPSDERITPVSPVPQQPYSPVYKPQPEQQYQPPKHQQSQPQSPIQPDQRRPQQQHFDQYRPQQYQQQPQSYEQYSPPEAVRDQPRYQPPPMERQPPMPTAAAAYQEPQPEVRTSTAHLGSLYIPPLDQQKRIVSPPIPPERNQDSPKLESPSLREAPKPWQIKKTQQEETPAWAKKENQNITPPMSREQQSWPQSRPTRANQPDQQQQQPIGVRIEIRTKPDHPEAEVRKPDAVYVTQPVVLQHPGPRMTPQQEQRERRVETRGERIIPIQIEGATQAAPNAERSFQRQHSNPTQSNKFKIIQKFTNTDEDDTEQSPITEHSPKYPQNFQQQVSRGPQQNVNNGPHIRTVPIKMEGNEPQQQYVHPSEQVVPEPKKYMGSSIPGRSFRILQAMTAPDNNCANVIDQNEAFQYDEWEYNRPRLPYPYPPYWPHPNYPYPQNEAETTPSPRDFPTPLPPYWPHPYSYAEPYPQSEGESDSKSTPRNTPIPRNTPTPTPKPAYPPFWGYPPSNQCSNNSKPQSQDGSTEKCNSCGNSPSPWSYGYQDYNYYGGIHDDAPHYFDPYYYHYYYGYPPMYPPYPYYSTGEDSMEHEYVCAKEEDTENDTPTREIIEINASSPGKVIATEVRISPPTPSQDGNIIDDDNEEKESEDDRSNDASDEDEDESASDIDDEMDNLHQLSVILEESERAESRLRSDSVMSNSTTIADNSEDENDFNGTVESLPLKLCVTLSEGTEKTISDGAIERFDTEIYASFTLRSPSSTPRKCSPCRLDDNENGGNTDNVKGIIMPKDGGVQIEDRRHEVEPIVSEEGKESDGSEDWWGILGDEDDMPMRKNNSLMDPHHFVSGPTADCPADPEEDDITDTTHTDNGKCIYSEEKEYVDEDNVVSIKDHEICEGQSNQCATENRLENSKTIYEAVEDENQSTDRKLMHVEDFASQFAQIQENFGSWNLKVLKKIEIPKKAPKENIHVDQTCLEDESIEFCENYSCSNDLENLNVEKKNTYERTETNSKCSADYTEYNFSKSSTFGDTEHNNKVASPPKTYIPTEIDSSSDETDSSSDEDKPNTKAADLHEETEEVKVPTIKERIQALKDSIEEKQRKIQENKIEIQVKDKVYSDSSSQSRSKTASTKSSVKSLEEFSEEEEIDSGVTSDMSRHISDNEEFPELRRLTRYQRAATHSRLFKLLQEECDTEDQLERESQDIIMDANNEQFSRRNNLTLPLYENNCKEYRVTQRLINETVQSFLRHKKAQGFRNIADDKLRAAAAKILEEELELFETPSTDCSSFLSPNRNSTGYSTTVPTPQEFNGNTDEYRQYYESWSNADAIAANNDYAGSRSNQDYWNIGKNGVVGTLGKCPRIPSPQNVHQKMIKLLERPQTPRSRTKSNDVTNAS